MAALPSQNYIRRALATVQSLVSQPDMSKIPECVVERWLTAADNHLRQPEPSEQDYILAMMCANNAWEHCDGMFPTQAILSIYRGICNESFAKEDVALRCWSQAVFSIAEAVQCYNVAQHEGYRSWEEEVAERGVLRCSVMRKQVLEAIDIEPCAADE